MLEKIPRGLGHALRGVRAGYEKIVGEGPTPSRGPRTQSSSKVRRLMTAATFRTGTQPMASRSPRPYCGAARLTTQRVSC